VSFHVTRRCSHARELHPTHHRHHGLRQQRDQPAAAQRLSGTSQGDRGDHRHRQARRQGSAPPQEDGRRPRRPARAGGGYLVRGELHRGPGGQAGRPHRRARHGRRGAGSLRAGDRVSGLQPALTTSKQQAYAMS